MNGVLQLVLVLDQYAIANFTKKKKYCLFAYLDYVTNRQILPISLAI